MQLLDGKVVSTAFKEKIKDEVSRRKELGEKIPHLAAILIGDNPASKAYVGNKVKTTAELGITSTLVTYDDTVSEAELLNKIIELNNNSDVDGILVQLPLPKHIDENKVIETIDAKKDVDGFHPSNLGRMMIGKEAFTPATPYGILLMLEYYNIETAGKHCVVIGRSNIVGTPISVLLSRNAMPGNCTVTLTHSHTKNLKELCASADIIIAAIGQAKFVTADMVKEGAVIIDVGINRIADATRKSGSRLVGDVDFEAVKDKVAYITPVPGGVGLMTIIALMKNTLRAVDL